jgi:hypothetical protein
MTEMTEKRSLGSFIVPSGFVYRVKALEADK